jgi:hypothetical protein
MCRYVLLRLLCISVPSLVLLMPPAAANPLCEVRSGAQRNPVIELYTSEGCSSCPPADRWLSTFRKLSDDEPVKPVVMAFHVSYWDYIGWIDRFALPAYNERQREQARQDGRGNIYTPQVVRDGADWPRWFRSSAREIAAPSQASAAAGASILLRRNGEGVYQAAVTPVNPAARWRAFWTVTEDGHSTKVKAGENRGEALAHDYVVRQYEPVSARTGPARLTLQPPRGEAGFAQRVNLVVSDAESGKLLQALSLQCAR